MKQEYSIRISEQDYQKLREVVLADLPRESAAFVLAGSRQSSLSSVIIARRIIEIPESEYRIKGNYHLDISPRAINGVIALCEQNGLGVIFCHSHPSETDYSETDDAGEERLAKTLWQFLPGAPIGSLLFTPTQVHGRIWTSENGPKPVTDLSVVGRVINNIPLNNGGVETPTYMDVDTYGRQIEAFGESGQAKIGAAKVAVVGVGGTGSPTAEQLIRLGVRDLLMIDKDKQLVRSNKTRVYGSQFSDIDPDTGVSLLPKVEIVANYLRKVDPAANIRTIVGSVVESSAVNALLDRDVIFCCTDEHWGRSVVNQIAYQYLIPVIEMGVRVDAKEGKIGGASGTVHVLRTGKPCLWCYQFLDARRIRSECLPPEEREKLLREGYVENLGISAPSVISLTTTISGLAVTTFLQLVTDFMGPAGDIATLQYSIMEGLVRRGTTQIQEDCICKVVSGFGDIKPLPTI